MLMESLRPRPCMWCCLMLSSTALTMPVRILEQEDKAVMYLQKFGYLQESTAENQILLTQALPAAVRQFQRMAALSETGTLDPKTIEMMEAPRCGVKDSFKNRIRRYTHSGTRWEKDHLTWSVTRHTSQLPRILVQALLTNAFNMWSDVTNLVFDVANDEMSVDIEILFSWGSHGDGSPFDGLGGVVAHAFYPPKSNHINSTLPGDLHFDDSEIWTYNLTTGQDLLSVAVHEIGHTVGLAHSYDPDSIMWPWSKPITPGKPLKLAYDDILGVQRLYGGKITQRKDPTVIPSGCGAPDAILEAVDGNIYKFIGFHVYKLDPSDLRIATGPSLIEDVFPGASGPIDAAVTFKGPWREAKSYLFTSNRYYRYSSINGLLKLDSSFPKAVSSEWGLRETGFNAVFTIAHTNTLVFVKGDNYWVHTGTSYGAYPGYPRPLSAHSIYRQLPGIQAAFLHRNRTNYFFNDNRIFTYRQTGRHTEKVREVDMPC